ncbi:MAG: ACP S-malonyltransferase [Bacteroidales bacterium]|jgi:[acyl-carrier-protein] S-malonyltransferase|nr:ACP S-malonyltransferase [Bacteroidota bacterium]
MKAYVFPGQGAQFTGMGKDLYDSFKEAKAYFELANKTLGFDLVQIMFEGSDDELKQTRVTQPAIFLHSVVAAKCLPDFKPDMVAGHSLGEFSALTAAGALAFEDGLRLVYKRAMAMQAACEKNPSTMAAVLGATDELVEQVCASIESEIVVPANYNCPGQIVISGSFKGVELASEQLKAAGVKRVLPLKVGGAFHSPLMESAAAELQAAISQTKFSRPCCPVYQNVDAKPYTDPVAIQKNLIAQLTSPVRWTQSVVAMLKDGAEEFIELGPGTVLQGLIAKIRANQ